MQNATEEKYVFLRSCDSDFEEAIGLIELSESQVPRIQYVLLRYAVIVYFRPFTKAETKFDHPQWKGPDAKFLRLGKKVIPEKLIEFHEEMETYRSSAYAHSDLAKRNPRLNYWPGHEWEFPIALSPVDKKPLHIHAHKLKSLCDNGLAHVRVEMASLEQILRDQYRNDAEIHE